MGTGVRGSGMVGCGPSSGGIATCSSLFAPALVAPCTVADEEDAVSGLSLIVTLSFSTLREHHSSCYVSSYSVLVCQS